MKQGFEWDEGKAKANLKKHRVGFESALMRPQQFSRIPIQ